MSDPEEQVRSIVRRVLLRTLGLGSSAEAGTAGRRQTITEADLRALDRGESLVVPAGALVTPLARDMALDRGVTLVEESAPGAVPAPASRRAPAARVVAVGSDHGGFAMKEDLKAYLGELGYDVVDCGTHSTAAVDYPDLAYAVARLVSEGRAWRGIVVDGAGIGSCMAANKVPGVRAALCYDHASAVNSREHNDANVLTLGGMLLGPGLARQVVKAWLETEFGGGRHARRVEKIMQIERRFLRP
ncbi:MAG TPA: ribose 5-phosphate isomerase B [Anaerolineae bacterium]|nr:ribose 5-phosphate isomerase B [Anaerolineae bacterium]